MRSLVSRASGASEASGTRPGTQRETREAQYGDALRASILLWVPGLVPLGLKKPSLHSPGTREFARGTAVPAQRKNRVV